MRTMRTPSTDIFGPVEENNDENLEEEVEDEEEEEEEPEEQEENEDDTGSSEEEGEVDNNDETDPWSPLRQKLGEDLKETYLFPKIFVPLQSFNSYLQVNILCSL